MSDRAGPREIALIDGGSFVLPYDHALACALAAQGRSVQVFASHTRYNEEFLHALAATPQVQVHAQAVSSTSAPSRWAGLAAYARLLKRVWDQRSRWACVNLQFSAGAVAGWPLEWPLWRALKRAGVRLAYTVHNAVPHGFRGTRHTPTARLAALADQLLFASRATRDEFLARYGAHHAARCAVLPHGLLPLAPGDGPQPVRPLPQPEALVFWGTVKPYKGVDLFAALARDPALRARGLGLEIHGQWDTALYPLRDELRGLGVRIEDGFLDAEALRALMARPVLFLLPYHHATQSGALYTLLHQGCTFACSPTGDLADVLQRHGLPELALADRTPAAVHAVLDTLAQQATATAARLQAAQDAARWPRLIDTHHAAVEAVYGPAPAAPADRTPPLAA